MDWNAIADVVKILKPELDRRQVQAAVDMAARRTALIAERASLTKQAEKVAAAGTARADKLKAVVAEAQVALTAAQARHSEACRLAAAELWPLTQRISAIEGELWTTQPESARHAVMRTLGLCQSAYALAAEVLGVSWDGRPVATWSNVAQVQTRINAILAAVHVARSWATAAVDDADLERRFIALVASLPAVDEAPERAA